MEDGDSDPQRRPRVCHLRRLRRQRHRGRRGRPLGVQVGLADGWSLEAFRCQRWGAVSSETPWPHSREKFDALVRHWRQDVWRAGLVGQSRQLPPGPLDAASRGLARRWSTVGVAARRKLPRRLPVGQHWHGAARRWAGGARALRREELKARGSAAFNGGWRLRVLQRGLVVRFCVRVLESCRASGRPTSAEAGPPRRRARGRGPFHLRRPPHGEENARC
mmetsp:Transcript_99997/g.282296  ORF Transcript_99997/g.282296 Transcript_99997/m.282296 type:complete len:220 (-) Transcript_99997:533-1192(-)